MVCEGPHSKYHRSWGSYDLCHNYWTLSFWLESSHRHDIKLYLPNQAVGCSSADRLRNWGGKESQGERGGRWAPAERMRRPGKDLKLGSRGEEGPSEGGDRIDSLLSTPDLTTFWQEAEALTGRCWRDQEQARWAYAPVWGEGAGRKG